MRHGNDQFDGAAVALGPSLSAEYPLKLSFRPNVVGELFRLTLAECDTLLVRSPDWRSRVVNEEAIAACCGWLLASSDG